MENRESNGLMPSAGTQPAGTERVEHVIRCELTAPTGGEEPQQMDPKEVKRYVHALRAMEKKLAEMAHEISYGPPPPEGWEQTTRTGQTYMTGQLNAVRTALSEYDPTVAVLFPEVPAGLAPGELAAIAGQLAAYLSAELEGLEGEEAAPSAKSARASTTHNVAIRLKIGDGAVFGDPKGIEGIGAMLEHAIGIAVGDESPEVECTVETE
jgi:hypothetical protein